MIRKMISFAAILLGCTTIYAQNVNDALRYSEQYSEGTARSVAMGNAFTALGGDMGGIQANPASSAIYRYSEVVFTPSLTNVSGSATYLGSQSSSNKTRAGVSNFGFIGSYETGRRDAGLVSWSFGLVLNKQNNFTGSMKAYGRTSSTSWLSSLAANSSGIYAPDMDITNSNNPYYYSNASWNSILGWNTTLLDTLPGTTDQYIAATENLDGYDISVGGELEQMFKSSSVGNVTEATINLGGNFSNKLYLGLNIGIQSIYYKYEERYAEQAADSYDFQTGFEYFDAAYRYKATGTGINLKAGLIYIPADWIRIGAAISTPTWMYLSEEWENSMQSQFNDGYGQGLLSPLGTYNYRLNTPFRWNIGAAFKLGTTGVLSADYESVDYTKAKLLDADYDFGYEAENSDIKNMLAKQNIIRIGAEVNVNPAFAIRAGYRYYSSPYSGENSNNNRNIGSFGLGYMTKCGASDFFIDLTYQQLLKKAEEVFSLYQDTALASPKGFNKTNNWKLLISLGLRF